MTQDRLKETREMFQKAGIVFTDIGRELQVQRKYYSLRLNGNYIYGMDVEMKAIQSIRFTTHQLLVRDLDILDNLCEVRHLLASLLPRWSRTEIMLLFGKNPGDPVLQFHCGDHGGDPIRLYDRPSSISSIHKYSPVHRFAASATPKEMADYIRAKHTAVQPAVSWEDFVEQWNLQHSARLGYRLSFGNSYIYACAGVRFLHEGKVLLLDVFQPVSWVDFPKIKALLDSVLQTAKKVGLQLEIRNDSRAT